MGGVLEGTLRLTVDDQVWDLEPGDAFWGSLSREKKLYSKAEEILDKGRVCYAGRTEELAADGEVQQRYLAV